MPDIVNPTPEQMKKLFEEMQRKENEGLTPEEIEEKERKKAEKKQKNIALMDETLSICQDGFYEKDGKPIPLRLTPQNMANARVFMPEVMGRFTVKETDRTCVCSCENKDALSLAWDKLNDPAYADEKGEVRVLVLNLANAIRPGGGVRDGMGGQEEELCRDSSLLLSLESEAAKPYYAYNKELNTLLGSDGAILSPDVVVFRNEKGELLDTPFPISVITCSAPNVRLGLQGKSQEEYEQLLYNRIKGLLSCAACLGFRNVILGAFGCGAFGNDAALVSDTFYKVLSGPVGGGLDHADFAVLCTPGKEYNYNEFCRNFSGKE